MRRTAALIVVLIPVAAAAGWLAGGAAQGRWARATPPPVQTPLERSAPVSIDLVVEYEPPGDQTPEPQRASPKEASAPALDVEPRPSAESLVGEKERSALQRLMELQARIGRGS